MEKFKHVKPQIEHERQAIEYINEFYKYNSKINGVGGFDKYLENYSTWLQKLDEDINETGIKQAEEARKKVEKLDIDLIICSPLLRTKHTCNIINANNIPIIYDKRLEERDCGKLTNEKLGEFYYTDYWNYYSNKKIEGLETIPELFKRVSLFLDEIKEKYKDKNILIVNKYFIVIL